MLGRKAAQKPVLASVLRSVLAHSPRLGELCHSVCCAGGLRRRGAGRAGRGGGRHERERRMHTKESRHQPTVPTTAHAAARRKKEKGAEAPASGLWAVEQGQGASPCEGLSSWLHTQCAYRTSISECVCFLSFRFACFSLACWNNHSCPLLKDDSQVHPCAYFKIFT